MRLSITSVLCPIVLVLLGGCGGGHDDDTVSPTPYSTAKQTWAHQGIENYHFTMRTLCFCPVEDAIRIVVVQGLVASATFVDSGLPVPAARLPTLRTLSGLFDLADQAYAQLAASVRFTNNASLGYLEYLFIDPDLHMADEEIGYQISDFAIDPPLPGGGL